MSSPKIKTWISNIPKTTNPGSIISGIVHVQNSDTKPLSLTELILTLHGTGTTRIFREPNIAIMPLQGRWKSNVTYIERGWVLVDGSSDGGANGDGSGNENVSIAPRQVAEYPFTIRTPTISEIEITETRSERRKKDWVEDGKAVPFAGVKGLHPTPPITTFKSEYKALLEWGTVEAHIEYSVTASGRLEGKHWARPFATQKIIVGAPAVKPVSPTITEQPKQTTLSQTLMGKHKGVTATVKFPTVLTQGKSFPVEFSIYGEGFTLISLKAKLFTAYAVRGRSSWLRESVGSAISQDKLMAWEGKQDLTKGQVQLVQSQPILPTDAVAVFSTLNVACLAHGLEVKFKVQYGKGKAFAGVLRPVDVKVRGPEIDEEI
ncbi:hypothetical protein BDV19DRAFT_384796 [Aspergillus venezuelensis]